MIAFDVAGPERVHFHDLHPATGDLVSEALHGLRQTPKTLPCKYFYDALGARLFESITELQEYYPTRTELGIMSDYSREMAHAIGAHSTLVEFGSGASTKTRRLLDALHDPAGCILIDISRDALRESAMALSERYSFEVFAVCADYTQDLKLPKPHRPSNRSVAYFPGSTIGNFEEADAQAFLTRVATLVGPGGGLLIGIDRRKDPAVIERAYNDALGVTAAFNLNILARLNRAGANFDLSQFRHHAPYVVDKGRIEMRLISQVEQTVRLRDEAFQFDAGELITTEYSHKYDLGQFEDLANRAGFRLTHYWSDPREWFTVCLLEV